MIKQKIIRSIEQNAMFGCADKVLVAVSGGADSVALLRVLVSAGYDCVAAHCNFHLRGEESDRDERFVRNLCQRLGVSLQVTHFQTKEYADQRGLSVEMAARELRYGWFEEVRKQTGSKVIAVAHHRNDNVETFLLNLVRGTGINGLKGIRPVNGRVVRPMLDVSREEILGYLQTLGQDYVTDSTNLQDEFTRNKLRLRIIPALAEMNPSIAETIAETARRLADVDAVYREAIQRSCREVRNANGDISTDKLMQQTAPRAVLHELLYPLGFNAAQERDIYTCVERAESGRKFFSQTHMLLTDRQCLILRSRNDAAGQEPVPVLRVEHISVAEDFVVPKDPQTAYLDAGLVHEPLSLRLWAPGDRFVPFGMTGFKSVRNYLRDRKFSLFDKEKQWVACDASGHIVWIVGERTDNRFRVTPDTREVLRISIG